MKNLITANKPIVAALLLDTTDQFILEAAVFLANKLQAPLHLVHAVRPLFSYVGAGDIVVNPYSGYESRFTDAEEGEARSKLDAHRNSLRDLNGLLVTTDIVRDFPAEAILNYAQEKDASLIVCGVRSPGEEHKSFLSGLSTGFTLAADAEVPVLLVPLSRTIPLGQSLRILVADNLEGEGERALDAGLWLANALHAAQLTHVHVQNTTYSEIDKMIDSVREGMLMGQIPSDPLLNRDYYMERVRDQTREELQRRVSRLDSEALNNTVYEPVVAFGHPAEAVHAEVLRSASQLMIFGRHHLIRRKTMSLGRIPYHAMVEDGIATLVVPDAELLTERSNGIEAGVS